jgi:hypothetical protein
MAFVADVDCDHQHVQHGPTIETAGASVTFKLFGAS